MLLRESPVIFTMSTAKEIYSETQINRRCLRSKDGSWWKKEKEKIIS